jgi:DNA-binding XRE family transcriptional regulator
MSAGAVTDRPKIRRDPAVWGSQAAIVASVTAASAPSSRPAWTTLRVLREAAGLSRADLSTLSGVDKVTVWRIEAGRCTPNQATLVALALALEVDPRDLANPPQGANEADDR